DPVQVDRGLHGGSLCLLRRSFERADERRPGNSSAPGRSGRGAPAGRRAQAGPTIFAFSRSASGQRTVVAQPSFSKILITRAEMSIWPLSTPCRAQVGSAWCRLCQDSPKEGTASHHTFRERSRTSKFSSPMVWQMEFTDQVTCCCSARRTSPAQKNAV